MSNILKGLNEGRNYGRDSWDSNMPGYQGDYGGAANWGRRNREDDEHHEIDAILAARHAQKQEYEKNGKFWLKLKDSQRHLPAGPFTGKQAANTAAIELLKRQPELKGNLVITAYGPDETQGVAEGSDELYGLRVGDTVKAVVNGKRVQGDVIDIFPETMEVELLLRGANAGRTITVDVRDTESLNELSNNTLASYKKKAGADASAADKRGDYSRGNKRMSGIVRATNKEFDNDAKPSGAAKTDDNLRAYYAQLKAKKQGVTEGVNHSALQGWDEMDASQKRLALDAAGVMSKFDTAFKSSSELDDILHSARVKAQNQEDELNIGASGRRELQRQAKQDFEAQRQQLFKEKMEMERFAWEKANTEAERKHELNKIEKEYLHDLRRLQMAHDHDMQKILQADTHELNKMKAEFNMRQKEREQGKPKPQPPEQQSEPDDGDNFDQDTGEPLKPGFTRPQSNQWHTSQQVGYTPTKPTKPNKDDVTDVEIKPNRPLALGNSKPVDETTQRLDPKCWKGYKKQGTKMKGDTRVNNCVPVKKESAIMKGLVDEDRQGDK